MSAVQRRLRIRSRSERSGTETSPQTEALTPENTTPENTTPENATPENATPEALTPETPVNQVPPTERQNKAGRSNDTNPTNPRTVSTAGVQDPPEEQARPVTDDPVAERGLRGLIGNGASQVGVVAAFRARDAARPTEADLAAARSDLVIVRRGWVPREELPRPTRSR